VRIAVASGKGGTGKTTVALALAKVLGSCVLVDCDVEAPNAYLFLDRKITGGEDVHIMVPAVDEKKCTGCAECSRVCQFNALAVLGKHVILFPELCHGCGACVLVCEPGAITEGKRLIGEMQWGNAGQMEFYDARLRIGEPMSPPLIKALKLKAAGKAGRDVVLDCPPGTTCPMIEAVGGADYCVLVTEPTPFGLSDLLRVHGLANHFNIPLQVIINKADLNLKVTEEIKDWADKVGVKITGELPYDPVVTEAMIANKAVVELGGTQISDGIKAIWKKVEEHKKSKSVTLDNK